MKRLTHRISGLTAALILAALLAPARSAVAGTSPVDDSDNVIVVLDCSGSMDDGMGGVRKLDAARSAIKQVLTKLPSKVRVGILAFPSRGWIYRLGPKDDAEIGRALDGLEAGGGTPLAEAIRDGSNALLQQRAKQYNYGSYRLLVVTDGEADDNSLVDVFVLKAQGRGIVIDAIGVNMAQDHTLATKIHSYRRADDPKSLTKAVRQVFAEVTATGSKAVTADDFALIAPLSIRTISAAIAALGKSYDNRLLIEGEYPVDEPATGSGSSGGGSVNHRSGGGCACDVSRGSDDVPAYVAVPIMLFVLAFGYLIFRRLI